MAHYYVITVGGTGSRQGEMLIHLAAIGMLPECDLLTFYIVDADTKNGDTDRMQRTQQDYMQMKNAIRLEGSKFDDSFMKPIIETKVWCIGDSIQKLGGGKKDANFSDIANSGELSGRILNMLHPKYDQNVDLVNGFYGDPAMGAAIFNVVCQTDEFNTNDLFKDLNNDLGNNIECKIIITGSVFGGTGAAIFPNIAEKILEKCPSMGDNRDKLHIAGALMLPYFKFPSDKDDEVTSAEFLTKTASAMHYYNRKDNLLRDVNGRKRIFDVLLLCGYPLWDQTCDINVSGGSKQIHRLHFIEFLSGIMACDFLNGKLDNVNKDSLPLFTYMLNENDRDLKWAGNIDSDLKKKMETFVRFCIVMQLIVRPKLYSYENEDHATRLLGGDTILREMFKEGMKVNRNWSLEELRIQADCCNGYCKKFLQMLIDFQYDKNVNVVNLFDTLNAIYPALDNANNTTKIKQENKTRLVDLRVTPEDSYDKGVSHFTNLWGQFKHKDGNDIKLHMSKLYGEFYNMCQNQD